MDLLFHIVGHQSVELHMHHSPSNLSLLNGGSKTEAYTGSSLAVVGLVAAATKRGVATLAEPGHLSRAFLVSRSQTLSGGGESLVHS